MEATEIFNMERRVSNYVNDNLKYIQEGTPTPTAQDVLDHWDTNGPEGIGEPLTDEERQQFLRFAAIELQERGED